MLNFELFVSKLVEVFDETSEVELLKNPNVHSLADWDSLAALNLMAFFEEEFNIVLEAEEIQNISDIQSIYKLYAK